MLTDASDAVIDGPEQWARDASVFIQGTSSPDFFSECTGTLVTPRLVLTSAHCASGDGNPTTVSFSPVNPRGDLECVTGIPCPCHAGTHTHALACFTTPSCPPATTECSTGTAPMACPLHSSLCLCTWDAGGAPTPGCFPDPPVCPSAFTLCSTGTPPAADSTCAPGTTLCGCNPDFPTDPSTTCFPNPPRCPPSTTSCVGTAFAEQLPANLPAPVTIPVIGCNTDHYSGLLCSGEGTLSTLNAEGDIAVLVLEERIDVGLTGLRTSSYPAVPARVITNDPGNDASSWWHHAMDHVGFGCRNWSCSDQSHSPLRDIARQNVGCCRFIGDVIPIGSDTDSTSGLDGPVGAEGDSGGGVFDAYDGSPGAPHRLLGVFNISVDQDRYVRVTSGTIQSWLTTVLGARHPETGTWGGAYIPVGSVEMSPDGRPLVDAIFPSAGRVWAGDSDLPPRTEISGPLGRAQWAVDHACAPGTTCNDPDRCALCGNPDVLDPDGDGLVLGHDNCWGIYNPAQHMTDPGATFAPTSAFDPSTAGEAMWCTMTGIHFHDVPGLHCLPRTVAAGAPEPSIDADGDSVPDPCDDCNRNDPHQNLDCAGEPWACAPDTDHDGIPDACDACNAVSLDTRDCNFDAERTVAHGTEFIADGCDPIECPDTTTQPEAVSIVPSMPGPPSTFLVRDRVQVDPIVSQLPSDPARIFHTGFRFCPCSLATGDTESVQACELPVGDGSGGCTIALLPSQIRDAFDVSRSEPARAQFFHPTLDGDARIDAHQQVNLPYSPSPGIDMQAHWQILETDLPRWRGSFGGSFPTAILGPAVSGGTPTVNGVFWAQALRSEPGLMGAQGMMEYPGICGMASPPHGCGFHCDGTHACPAGTYCGPLNGLCRAQCSSAHPCPHGATCGEDGTCGFDLSDANLVLARHYEAGPVGGAVPTVSQSFIDVFAPLVDGHNLCPQCSGRFPIPWLAGPCASPDDRPPCGWDGLQTPVLAFGDVALTVAASNALAPSLSMLGGLPHTRWVAAAEPPTLIREDGLRYAALSADGGLPVRLLALAPGGLGFLGKFACNKGGCQRVALPADAITPSAAAVEAAASDPKTSRTDYAMALSGLNATIWIAGGVDAAGQELHDVIAYHTDDAIAHTISTGPLTLGHVHALAWNPMDQRLYAIDEMTEGHRSFVRLVSIAPDGSGAREETRWHRTLTYDVFALAFDPLGRVWIAASRERHGAHHVVSRLTRTRGSWRLDGYVSGDGAVHREGAYATVEGLSLAIAGPHVRIAAYAEVDLQSHCGLDPWF